MHRKRRRSTSCRLLAGRLALASAILGLWAAADAGAAVVRLQVDWAPADGTTVMTPPYLFADSASGSSRHQGICSSPGNCSNAPGTRWQEENHDSGGQPRRISFIDDTTTQYSTYNFSIAHPFAGFGPNVVGTATITHADGRTYTVPFDVAPTPDPFDRTALGVSEGLPLPGGGEGGGGGPGGQGPKPVLGSTVVVKVKGELVRIRRPGTKKFVELKGVASIPVGSVLDTLKGKVKLTSATDASGKVQTAHFAGGVFKVLQTATDPLTTLRLVGRLGAARPGRAARGRRPRRGRRAAGGCGAAGRAASGRAGVAARRRSPARDGSWPISATAPPSPASRRAP
jgi:hypothetical protein